MSDGPFADTKEWIAGYDIVTCQTSMRRRDRRTAPMARLGAVEVRPFWSA